MIAFVNPIRAFNNQNMYFSERIYKYAGIVTRIATKTIKGAVVGAVVGAVEGAIVVAAVRVGAVGGEEAGVHVVWIGDATATIIVAVKTVVSGAVAFTEAVRAESVEDKRPRTINFCQAVLKNYYQNPLLEGAKLVEKSDFEAGFGESIPTFNRLVIEELMRCPEAPTVNNTPRFLHSRLDQINILRNQFQRLDDPKGFSLLVEMDRFPDEMRELAHSAWNLAGEMSTARGPQALNWIGYMTDAAASLQLPAER